MIYKNYGYSQEFDVTTTLELNDDGRFSYSEIYSSYGGGYSGEVQGSWWQTGDTISLRVEYVGEGINPHEWVKGEERQAIEQEDNSLDFGGGFTLS